MVIIISACAFKQSSFIICPSILSHILLPNSLYLHLCNYLEPHDTCTMEMRSLFFLPKSSEDISRNQYLGTCIRFPLTSMLFSLTIASRAAWAARTGLFWAKQASLNSIPNNFDKEVLVLTKETQHQAKSGWLADTEAIKYNQIQ